MPILQSNPPRYPAPTQRQYTAPVQLVATYPYASFLTRFVAFLIDSAIVGLIIGAFAVLGVITSAIGAAVLGPDLGALSAILASLLFIPLAILLPVLYYVKLETGPNQGTLGKQFMGLRVVTLQGYTLSMWQSVGRFLVRFFLSGAFLGVGYFLALFTQHKQALHDLVASTVVLKR